MRLPATPYYVERLNNLRPAELAEQIALVFKLKALNQLVDFDTLWFFDRLTAVDRQDQACILLLCIWLLELIELRALSPGTSSAVFGQRNSSEFTEQWSRR